MKWTAQTLSNGKFPQWGRLDNTEKLRREAANSAVLNSKPFLEACQKTGVEPTRRQASKWNNKKGKAYNNRVFRD